MNYLVVVQGADWAYLLRHHALLSIIISYTLVQRSLCSEVLFGVSTKILLLVIVFFFFFQAEDGIRDYKVTGVQTCALPIYIATVSNRIQSAFDSEAVNELRRSIRDFGQVADKLVKVTNEQAEVIGSVGSNLRQGSDVLAKAATNLQATLGRVDSATNQGQLATILNNSATTSANLQSASCSGWWRAG